MIIGRLRSLFGLALPGLALPRLKLPRLTLLSARPTLLARLAGPHDAMAALVLEQATGPALVIDDQARVVRVNAACAALWNTAPPMVEQVFHPGARDAAMREIGAALRSPAVARHFNAVVTARPAAQDMCVCVLPFAEPGRPVSGAVLRLIDLTPQRALEAQLAHSQKLQAMGQLAGGIAHDFNNLLTAILGAAEEIAGRQPDAGTAEDAAQIRASAQRGAGLVRQLLAFGRQQTLQPRPLAVNEVISEIAGLLRRLLGAQVRLTLELEEPGRLVRADPTQLDQVIVNLVVNARDAMPQGGDLTVRSGHVTLFRPLLHGAEAIPPGRYAMIEVQDTGLGIPPEVLPRIFDPFFTTRREAGGSGLGLSTVHGIVRQSDGFLAVDSVPGQGTSMRIYLPRWDRTDAPQPESRVPAVPDTSIPVAHGGGRERGTILLVDDEEPVRRLAERALRRAGWDVRAADSGESALAILAVDDVCLAAVVSDMMMPGIDGATLAREVRQRQQRPDLPVLLMSGYAKTQLRGGLQDPTLVFLAKPYSLAELVTAVDRATAAQV